MRWNNALTIINPRAGRWGSEKNVPRLVRELFARHGGRVTLRSISGSSDARTWAEHAASEGFDLVIVCGGDGTVNETVNGLAGGEPLPLAVIPTGSGNVFAQELGIPKSISAAVGLIEGAALRAVDLGNVTSHGRVIVCAATVGYGSKIIADAKQELKNVLGYPAYVLTALKHIIRIETALFDCRFDGRAEMLRAQMLVIANGGLRSIHLGNFVPPVSIDDGALDIFVFSHKRFQDLVSLLAGMVLSPKIPSPALPAFRAHTIEITASPSLPFLVDGEPCDNGKTISITTAPKTLKVLVPRALEEKGQRRADL